MGNVRPWDAGTPTRRDGTGCRGDRLAQSVPRRSPRPYGSPLVSAGAAEAAGAAVVSLRIHPCGWEGGFSPRRGSGAGCQPERGGTANTFFAIFSSAASCWWIQRILLFFFFSPSKFQIFFPLSPSIPGCCLHHSALICTDAKCVLKL